MRPEEKKSKSSSKNKEALPNKELETTEETAPRGDRLNKYVANAGICARRKADEFIKQGYVKVNDVVVQEMGYRVKPNDVVTFKGKLVTPIKHFVYYLLNKPKNTITTTSDERGRTTVLDIFKNVTKERIYPVGRLDRDTTGLLVMTNDGQLAQKMTHPSHGVKKMYHATLDKPVTKAHIEAIRAGLELTDGKAPVDKVSYVGKATDIVGVELHIGRNRIVRRIFEHLGYEVKKLDRIYLGGLTKKDLPRGWHRPLTKQEVIMLKHFA